MERYFFLIFDNLSAGEKSYLLNFFGEEKIFGGHQLSSLTLPYRSIYIYILNLKRRWKKHIEWKKINTVQEIVQLVLKSCDNIDNTKSEDVYDYCSMAECINNLADLLPAPGTFFLDVIASSNFFENLNVSDNIEVAASLHRLSEWHSAHTCWLTLNAADSSSNLREWLDLTHAEAVDVSKPSHISLLFWRGAVEFKHPNASTHYYKGFELRMDSENSQQMHLYLNSVFNVSNASEHLLLHPVLKSTEICRFSSIPQHLLLPFAFKLCISNSHCYDSSLKFFTNIKEKNDVALILRMGYSKLNDKPKPDKLLNTNKWLKIVSSGNVKYPESCLPDINKQLTLAVVPSENSDDVFAFIMRDTSFLDAQFYFSAFSIQNKLCFSPLRTGSRVERKTFSVPFVSETLFLSSLHKTRNLHSVSSESGVCEDFSTNNLLTSFIQCIGSSELVNHQDFGDMNAIYDEIDPSDWVERVNLLQRQIRHDEERKNKRNVFMSFSPNRSRYYVSFCSDDIGKYFEPTGEAKERERAEPIQSLGYNMNYNKDSLETIKKKKWPEILNCIHDDIYYNATKQSEENESIGNEMVKCYVHHETASTCNNHQNQPDAPISILAKSMTPRKRPSSSSKVETSFRQVIMKPNASAKEKFLKNAVGQSNPVISTIMKTLGVNKSSNAASSGNTHKKRVSRKNSLPVRCSPRKKCSVDYYSSSKNHSSTKKVQKNKTIKEKSNDGLPEILKKKLRSSIAISLESNGINIEDALFKPCFKRLFTICQVFVQDIQDNPRKLGTSQYIQEIAEEHVKPVIKFVKQKRK